MLSPWRMSAFGKKKSGKWQALCHFPSTHKSILSQVQTAANTPAEQDFVLPGAFLSEMRFRDGLLGRNPGAIAGIAAGILWERSR